MTNHKQTTEPTGNEKTVHNPLPAGQVEKVDPTTGGSAGTIDTHSTAKK